METRFIDGGEFVDKATYIETRDKLSRAIERIANLEAALTKIAHRDVPDYTAHGQVIVAREALEQNDE